MSLRFAIWISILILVIFTIYLILHRNKKYSNLLAIISTLLTFITFSVTWIIPETVLSLNVQDIFQFGEVSMVQDASLFIGETLDLSNRNISDDPIRWKSNDEHIAIVDNSGRVTALFEGNTEIELLTESGRTLITWELSVISPRIDVSTDTLDLYISDNVSLAYVTYPSGLDVIWDSNDSAIATVNSSGSVEAVSNGSTTISATINYAGRSYFQNCQVIVHTPSISLFNHDITLNRGNKELLSVETFPTNQTISWASSDVSIIAVDENGTITTGSKNGTATISAIMYYNGVEYQDTCTVIVDSVPVELSEIYRMAKSHGGFYKKESVTDIYGNVWNGTAYYAYLEGFNGYEDGQSSERYYTNQQYERLYGKIVLPSEQYNTYYTAYLKVYGDDHLLYTSPPISTAFAPVDFEVDISGVSELEIELV